MKKYLSVLTFLISLSIQVKAQNVLKDSSIFIKEKIVDDNKFTVVEQESQFPGGMKEWIKFLQQNLNPMIPIDNKAKKGLYTVIVKFVVDKEGVLTDIETETNHGFGMEKEAIRVLKKSPKWKPGKQNGTIVSSVKKQPITFMVQ